MGQLERYSGVVSTTVWCFDSIALLPIRRIAARPLCLGCANLGKYHMRTIETNSLSDTMYNLILRYWNCISYWNWSPNFGTEGNISDEQMFGQNSGHVSYLFYPYFTPYFSEIRMRLIAVANISEPKTSLPVVISTG